MKRKASTQMPADATTASQPSATKGGGSPTWSEDLNWGYAENGPGEPKANAGLRTLFAKWMCPGSGPSGLLLLDEQKEVLVAVAALLEEAGLRRDRKYDDPQNESLWAESEILPCFLDPSATDAPAATIKLNCSHGSRGQPMIEIVLSEKVTAAKESAIAAAFARGSSPMSNVCSVPHVSVPPQPFIKLGMFGEPDQALPGYTLEYVTGTKDGSFSDYNEDNNISTFFSLKDNGVEVGKGLWTYFNAEMGIAGPAIEMIEVAKEYQRRGLGTALYVAMESIMLEPFKQFEALQISATYVTNEAAARFFSGCAGFRDASGLLEELSKRVYCPRGYVGKVWEWDEDDAAQGASDIARLDRSKLVQLLPQYNAFHGSHITGQEVRGNHRKPCSVCGTQFEPFLSEMYYTDTAKPWGAEKYCEECMAAVLAEFEAEHPEEAAPQQPVYHSRLPWTLNSAPGYLKQP